jgi:hypothetical protein
MPPPSLMPPVKAKAFPVRNGDYPVFPDDFDNFVVFPAVAGAAGCSADIGFPDCATFLGTFSDEVAFGDYSVVFLGDFDDYFVDDFADNFVAVFLEVFPDGFDYAFPDNSEAFPDDDWIGDSVDYYVDDYLNLNDDYLNGDDFWMFAAAGRSFIHSTHLLPNSKRFLLLIQFLMMIWESLKI